MPSKDLSGSQGVTLAFKAMTEVQKRRDLAKHVKPLSKGTAKQVTTTPRADKN